MVFLAIVLFLGVIVFLVKSGFLSGGKHTFQDMWHESTGGLSSQHAPASHHTAAASATADNIPASFPIKVKPNFFSRSEQVFFTSLQEALQGSPYTVFPNVRLNDMFVIQASGKERLVVLGRLRDKHVDFLITERGSYRPALGIELDGASHESEKQQYRDAVKDTLFASAGLPLLRLDARRKYNVSELRESLNQQLGALLQSA